MRALIALIVVLAVAAVAGDRIGATLAQREIAKRVAAQYGLPRTPRVDIHGVPFLTQAFDGRYPDVEVAVGDWTGPDVTVRDLDVHLDGVTASLRDVIDNRTENLVADSATATALVPYETVKTYAPRGVESIADGPDGLRVTGTFAAAGISVPAVVVVSLAPADDGIVVTPVAVQAVAGGPELSLDPVRQYLTFTVPLRRLPLGARLQRIEPAPQGLRVSAVAHDVHFDQPRPAV
jgi:hypothetical protein